MVGFIIPIKKWMLKQTKKKHAFLSKKCKLMFQSASKKMYFDLIKGSVENRFCEESHMIFQKTQMQDFPKLSPFPSSKFVKIGFLLILLFLQAIQAIVTKMHY